MAVPAPFQGRSGPLKSNPDTTTAVEGESSESVYTLFAPVSHATTSRCCVRTTTNLYSKEGPS